MNPDLIIRPEIVAGKLAAAADHSQPEFAEALDKQPRLVELLWFLQWLSMQPGGIKEWTPGFIKESAALVGPAALVNTPALLTEKDVLKMWRAFPSCFWGRILPGDAWKNRAFRQEREKSMEDLQGLTALFSAADRVYPDEERPLAAALLKLDRQVFIAVAMQAAELTLPAYLASWCNEMGRPAGYEGSEKKEPLTNPPWYFANIIAALFVAMDSHAQRVSAGLAQTEITLKVMDAVEYGRSENSLVLITGNARFGKTESVCGYCAAWPGRARLVTTPDSNLDADLWRAVADALGITHDYKTPPRKLKEAVEFTVRHSGLMFIFDESHFLLPRKLSASTTPSRLNWLRTNLVDRKVPVALVSTPQAYDHAVAKFVKASGYNIAQWTGRIMLQVTLPDELDFDDLLAIAKLKCVDMDADLQELIVAKAQQSENFIMAVEAIGKRARFIARRDSHPEITLADVDLATAEILPVHATASPKPPPASRADASEPRRTPGPTANRPTQRTGPPVAPKLSSEGGRNIRPAVNPSPMARDAVTNLIPV